MQSALFVRGLSQYDDDTVQNIAATVARHIAESFGVKLKDDAHDNRNDSDNGRSATSQQKALTAQRDKQRTLH